MVRWWVLVHFGQLVVKFHVRHVFFGFQLPGLSTCMVLFFRELSRESPSIYKPYGIKVPEIRAFASKQTSKQAIEKLSYEGGEY
jgi:hypothetical protein